MNQGEGEGIWLRGITSVIQKHSYVSSTDSIRSPHEINNEEDQQEPLKDVKDL